MITDYIFTVPDMYKCGEVLPDNCEKEAIELGMVPDEKCEIFPLPYFDVICEEYPVFDSWVLGDEIPIILS